MRSRVDVTVTIGEKKENFRGYWIIHPENKNNPTTFIPSANGATSTAAFNLSNSAAVQRWLILSAEEAHRFEGTTDIEEIESPTSQITDIYSITGVRLREGTAVSDLPSGIYIIGGRKVMIP
jgi:hypothetical protein